MTLSASSGLFILDVRNGVIPTIGGAPTFSRNSAGSWVDQTGTLQSAIVNTPRTEWAQLYGEDPSAPTALGNRRPVLTLEQARTNGILYSSDFSNAAWTKTNVTVTTGVADPMGGTGACTLTATASSATVLQTLSSGSSISRTNSVWIRRRAGTGSILIYDAGLAAYGAATGTIDSQWRRVYEIGGSGTGRAHGIAINTNGDAIDVYLAQEDDGPMSSGIATTSGSATRATDSLSWAIGFDPQALMIYVRHLEHGGASLTASAGLLAISSTSQRLMIYNDGSGGYRTNLLNANGVVETSALTPSLNETSEYVAILPSNGAIWGILSRNGAAVSSTAQTAPLALTSAWGERKLWLNSIGAGSYSQNAYAQIKVVKFADVVASTAQGIMNELRSFALDSRQGVL